MPGSMTWTAAVDSDLNGASPRFTFSCTTLVALLPLSLGPENQRQSQEGWLCWVTLWQHSTPTPWLWLGNKEGSICALCPIANYQQVQHNSLWQVVHIHVAKSPPTIPNCLCLLSLSPKLLLLQVIYNMLGCIGTACVWLVHDQEHGPVLAHHISMLSLSIYIKCHLTAEILNKENILERKPWLVWIATFVLEFEDFVPTSWSIICCLSVSNLATLCLCGPMQLTHLILTYIRLPNHFSCLSSH